MFQMALVIVTLVYKIYLDSRSDPAASLRTSLQTIIKEDAFTREPLERVEISIGFESARRRLSACSISENFADMIPVGHLVSSELAKSFLARHGDTESAVILCRTCELTQARLR